MNVRSQDPMLPFISFFNFLGKSAVDLVNNLGTATIFFSKSFVMIFRPKQLPEIIQQVYYMGARSSNIVMLERILFALVGSLPEFATPCHLEFFRLPRAVSLIRSRAGGYLGWWPLIR